MSLQINITGIGLGNGKVRYQLAVAPTDLTAEEVATALETVAAALRDNTLETPLQSPTEAWSQEAWDVQKERLKAGLDVARGLQDMLQRGREEVHLLQVADLHAGEPERYEEVVPRRRLRCPAAVLTKGVGAEPCGNPMPCTIHPRRGEPGGGPRIPGTDPVKWPLCEDEVPPAAP